MNTTIVDISIVTPVFNEETNIEELSNRLKQALEETGQSFELIFVDDGSTDKSLEVLLGLYKKQKNFIKIVKFSRNFGHQLALTAGLKHAQGKAVIVIDSDLQDPPEVIKQFIDKWKEGFDIIYGVRSNREGEMFFKLFTAKLFYKLIRAIANIDIPENVGDFYLLDRKVVNVFIALKERHRFNRGLISWIGFKRAGVEYTRKARYSGKTKYSFWKMVKFAFDAIMSFSFAPLRVVTGVGIVFSVISFLFILLIIYLRLFTQFAGSGLASIIVTILFMGGLQLVAIGLIGEYLARMGDDIKARPLFIVEEFFS